MMAENFSNLLKNIKYAGSSVLQIGKMRRDPQVILVKLLKANDKEKILKRAK